MVKSFSLCHGMMCSFSNLLSITNIFFVTFVLLARLEVWFVFGILIVAAQIVFVSQSEFWIWKYYIISALLAQVLSHSVVTNIIRARYVCNLRSKISQASTNFTVKFAVNIFILFNLGQGSFGIIIGDNSILFALVHNKFALFIVIALQNFIWSELVSDVTLVRTHLNLWVCELCLTFFGKCGSWLEFISESWRSTTKLTCSFAIFLYSSHSSSTKSRRGISILIVFLGSFLTPNTKIIVIVSSSAHWICSGPICITTKSWSRSTKSYSCLWTAMLSVVTSKIS